MAVGLPGVGLGGVFYLLSAAIMPVREAVRFRRGTDGRRLRLVVRQTLLATGILVALWATGWALGHMITAAAATSSATSRFVPHGVSGNALRVSALVLSVGTLALVLTLVQIARVVVRLQIVWRGTRLELKSPSVVEQSELRIDSGTFGRSR